MSRSTLLAAACVWVMALTTVVNAQLVTDPANKHNLSRVDL